MGANKKKAVAVCALMVFIFINLTPSGFKWQVGNAYHRIREVLPGHSPAASSSDELAEVDVEDSALAQPAQITDSRGDSLSVRIRLWRNTLQMEKNIPERGGRGQLSSPLSPLRSQCGGGSSVQ